MATGKILMPNPWCQEEVWKLVGGIEAVLGYIDNPWLPTAVGFTVSRDSVVIRDENGRGEIELQKGKIIVKTQPCTLFIYPHMVFLYECGTGKEAEGGWIMLDKNLAPFLNKEYFEAGELYERLRHIFKVLIGRVADKLGF